MSNKLQQGQRVETYTIRQELGQGGMSSVYLAHDEAHVRDVVLKFPHDAIMGDVKAYEHFRREVKIGQMLHHPNIQSLHALGGDSLSPFLVLEYVPGCTLREKLYEDRRRDGTNPPLESVIAIGTQIASALACVHANRIAHRDLKPENIIVTPDGTAKVMDFGIAYIEGARRVTWGVISEQAGTPDYMSPEQIKGVRGDRRTDIYALGMILYESITGRLPYEGDNALAIMNQHVVLAPRPIGDFCPDIPDTIAEVIMKAIRLNPEVRWQTMDEFAQALERHDLVNVDELRAEREREAQSASARPVVVAVAEEIPFAKAIIITLGIFVVAMALGLLLQWLHYRR